MDFSKLETKNESFCQLFHPTTDEPLCSEDGKKIGFKVSGVDSDLFRKVQAKILRKANPTGRKKMTPEKIEQMDIDQVAGIVTGVENIQDGGEVLKKDYDAIRAFFKKYRWAQEQITEHVNDRSNFL